jgi:hypothetical protein
MLPILIGHESHLETHYGMAKANKAVMVFFKEFQWDQRPRPLQNGLIPNHPKKISTDLKCPQCFKKKCYKENPPSLPACIMGGNI